MRIIVTIKQVPDPDIPPGHFKVDEAARKVVPPPGVAPVLNGYDANALEAALRLKEQVAGTTITLVSLGAAQARDALKRGLAMGADKAVLLDDPAFAQCDSAATAAVLAAAIRKLEGADLVLSGRQASDTDAGQVHLGVASLLGLPGLTPIQRLSPAGDGAVRVERLVEDGHQVLEVRLPAVLGISSEVYEPRYPPLKGIMLAGRAQIPVWGTADLGLTPQHLQPRRLLRRLYVEQREAQVELIAADSPAEAGEQLALKLREAKLI
ncbi:MAG: electron transfer flavoprotein subunit beta/FixA family protein [Chloroflexi bacterium]|nr:electron transfer flavoprotein subunit beta/FixA family protein [Chloroflexota bacterium]